MASDLNLLLFSASGGVKKGEKGVNFRVILGNRLSSAEKWTDRNEINCNGKPNVPARTY